MATILSETNLPIMTPAYEILMSFFPDPQDCLLTISQMHMQRKLPGIVFLLQVHTL